MKNKVTYFIASFIVIFSSCQTQPENSVQSAETSGQVKVMTEEEEILWGKKLVTTIDCGACHSPKIFTEFGPVEDPNRLLSGHPQNDPIPQIDKSVLNDWVLFGHQSTMAVGPWGMSFSANLTSDDTGIGNWTFEQFKTAITKGKYKGIEAGRDLLPPMPWPSYAQLEEAELRAIFKYLKSTTPVENIVPTFRPFESL